MVSLHAIAPIGQTPGPRSGCPVVPPIPATRAGAIRQGRTSQGRCRLKPSGRLPPASLTSIRPYPLMRTTSPRLAPYACSPLPTLTCGSSRGPTGRVSHPMITVESAVSCTSSTVSWSRSSPTMWMSKHFEPESSDRGRWWGAKPSLVHDLANTSGADATTLHVYSPPLAEISFFNLHTDSECQRLRTTAVPEAPQAGSEDPAPSWPPPLSLVI